MKLPAGFVPGVGVVQATARGGLGERLLKRMGWVDGAGLGVGGRGRATALANLTGAKMVFVEAAGVWLAVDYSGGLAASGFHVPACAFASIDCTIC